MADVRLPAVSPAVCPVGTDVEMGEGEATGEWSHRHGEGPWACRMRPDSLGGSFMRKRLLIGLLSAGLLGAMLPGVAGAYGKAPRVDTTGYCVATGLLDRAAFYFDGTRGPVARNPNGTSGPTSDTQSPFISGTGANSCRVPGSGPLPPE